MQIIPKIWGKTAKIYDSSNTEMYIAWINNNGQSSKHYHEHKYNYFYVVSGKLIINVWDKNTDQVSAITLGPEDTLTIENKIWHQFIALESTILIEIYWVEINDQDIIRNIPN